MKKGGGKADDTVTSTRSDAADLTKSNPKTKDEFIRLAQQVSSAIFERLHEKPLYSAFAEEIARLAVAPLKDVDTRKIGSAITAVASEKTKEAKDKASGKKKVSDERELVTF
jgi:translation initiation factor 3 subunit J